MMKKLQHKSAYSVVSTMLQLFLRVILCLLVSSSYGQLKKFYSLQDCVNYDTVDFSLEASAGNCFIRSEADMIGTMNIYGNPDLDKVNPSFKVNVHNNTCDVDLDLQEFKTTSISDGIFFAMLGSAPGENSLWKILFDHHKIYKLNLDYGFGTADVDLGGTSVKRLKIRSGSADVFVDYKNRVCNKIAMDTFMVKVDMGSLVARNIDCSQASYVLADIGFGKALLDFTESGKQKCTVKASVGAGNLDIFLPSSDVPMIIHVKESPLCGLEMLEGFEEVEKNVFVNMSYFADAENLLSFNLDVAMGNVAFHSVQN